METNGTYWMILFQMIALVFRILPGDFSTYANAFENVKYLMRGNVHICYPLNQ